MVTSAPSATYLATRALDSLSVACSTAQNMKRVILVALTAACAGFFGDSDSSSSSAAGTLTLQARLRVTSVGVACPPELSSADDCRTRTGSGEVPGLGTMTEKYVWGFRLGPPKCPANLVKPLATTGRLVVAGKGELQFTLADGTECVDLEPVRNRPQDFTITGGTGSYEGASGSGTVQRSLGGDVGTETWIGTIIAPRVEFDVTPPTLIGATSKTVRAPKGAKSVRVRYKVTANDAVDGAVTASCMPRSGSRFKVGRTLVTCSASDKSANTSTAKFRVTVRPAR